MPTLITSVAGIGGATAALLARHGFRTAEDLATASQEKLAAIPGFGENRAARTIDAARTALGKTQETPAPQSKPATQAAPGSKEEQVETASVADKEKRKTKKGKSKKSAKGDDVEKQKKTKLKAKAGKARKKAKKDKKAKKGKKQKG